MDAHTLSTKRSEVSLSVEITLLALMIHAGAVALAEGSQGVQEGIFKRLNQSSRENVQLASLALRCSYL